MDYMKSQMQTAMEAAEKQYRQDILRRRLVDTAVAQAMRHFDHIESEVGKRDLHHAAVAAALVALHLAIESDATLKALTLELDSYKAAAEKGLMFATPRMVVPAQGIVTEGQDAQRLGERSE